MLKVVGASWNKIRASTWIIGVVFVFGIIVVILGELGQSEEDGNWSATVYWSRESGFEIVFWGQGKKINQVPKGVARAYFQSHINTTGWAVLDIETQSDYPDWVQAFAAGMLEGSLSWQMIDWQRHNIIENSCDVDEHLCEDIKEYLDENTKWVKQMYSNKSSPYWHQIYLFYLQLQGVQRGFEQGVKRSRGHDIEDMTMEDFLWLNAMSDLDDLKHKFADSNTYRPVRSSGSTLLKKLRRRRSINYSFGDQELYGPQKKAMDNEEEEECGDETLSLASAFVKLVPDDAKLYVAHNTAGQYSSMLKMLKHYQFRYRKTKKGPDPVPGKKITFSSYPGVIHPVDGFFVIENDDTEEELVVAGVPIPVFNEELWEKVTPVNQVLIGPRVMAANRLSSNGREWTSFFSNYSSGTGNKEWIIADFMKFKKIADLKSESEEEYRRKLERSEGLLYIIEQIPGAIQVADETDALRRNSYWATFGLPFFQNITVQSGVQEKIDQCGDAFSYYGNPVAKMFRRDQVNATDMDSVTKLMRSNFYKTDPLSSNNPRRAIGSRGDLASEAQEPAPVGVTDTKVYTNEGSAPGGNATDAPPARARFTVNAGPPYSDWWSAPNRTKHSAHQESDPNYLSPFIWGESEFSEVPHHGHPDIWNFKPIVIF